MKKKVFGLLLMLFTMCLLFTVPVMAASSSKKAKKAYRKAILNGQINIPSKAQTAVSDANGDGIPELIVFNKTRYNGCSLKIYSYLGGSVKNIVSQSADFSTRYNPSTRSFHMYGEGAGMWREDYQLRGTAFVKTRAYSAGPGFGGLSYYKTINGVRQSITEDECRAAFRAALNCNNALKRRSKTKLLKILK